MSEIVKNDFRPTYLSQETHYLIMAYVNIINARGIKLHNLYNHILKSKFRYIIETEEQVKLEAWQKNRRRGVKYKRLVSSHHNTKTSS